MEDGGSLIAGTVREPFGRYGGRLTIHLYGKDQGPGTGTGDGGKGITCKTGMTCGVPDAIWNSNWDEASNKPKDPGLARKISDFTSAKDYHGFKDDYFYQYDTLPYDDGDPQGYFGYKVLAVSYGGTLQLFGRKGATTAAPRRLSRRPQTPGSSWVRLNGR